MKVLFKKLKRANKVELALYLLTLVYYLVSFVIFTISILNLKRIETFIRVTVLVFFGLWFLYYLIGNLMNIILKKHNKFAVLVSLRILLYFLLSFLSVHITLTLSIKR